MKILICLSGMFGGTDALLHRMYDWLITQDYSVDLMDYNSINKAENESYDIVYLPTSQIDFLWILKKHNIKFTKIVIWAMGHGAYTAAFYNRNYNKSLFCVPINYLLNFVAIKSIKHFMQLHSCIFTDEAGMELDLHGIKYINDELIYPIPIVFPQASNYARAYNGQNLVITWIGRVTKDFKEIPIKQIIYDLKCCLKNRSIQSAKFNIIGSGDALDEIKEYASLNNIKCEYKDYIDPNEIGAFLEQETDLMIAMGTSALDGAKYGCPTAVINALKKVEENSSEYRWIYESKGYSLGEFKNVSNTQEQVQKTFKELLAELEIHNIGEQCYEYAQQFDINIVLSKLLNRSLPKDLNNFSWFYIGLLYLIKKMKLQVKKFLRSYTN